MLAKRKKVCYNGLMEKFALKFDRFSFSKKEYREMDTDQLKKHVHPFYEVLLLLEGEVEYAIENRYYRLQKGDLLLIAPAQYHFVRQITKAPYRRYCLNFTEDFAAPVSVRELYARGERFSLGEESTAKQLLDLLAGVIDQTPGEHREELCVAYLHALLLSLEGERSRDAVPQRAVNNFQKILDHINLNLTSIRSIEDIAGEMFFSKSYINHLFKKELGIGVMQYIRNKRILLAHQRMQEGKKPTDVYAECGFSNYVTFYRAYCQYFGNAPSSLRRR